MSSKLSRTRDGYGHLKKRGQLRKAVQFSWQGRLDGSVCVGMHAVITSLVTAKAGQAVTAQPSQHLIMQATCSATTARQVFHLWHVHLGNKV